MKKVLHRAEARGKGEHGWLSTRYSFSFADWYEPSRMGFGALRVLNDDTIAPARGFPMHAHRDMEIITIVTHGAVAHRDSIGNAGVVPSGEVQVMSAGTGIVHAEFNASSTEPLTLFQIWIEPEEKGVLPHYAQKAFPKEIMPGESALLVGPTEENGALRIGAGAYISRVSVDAKHPVAYALHDGENGAYLFVITGDAEAEGENLGARDALGVTGIEEILLSSKTHADVLVIEVPRARD